MCVLCIVYFVARQKLSEHRGAKKCKKLCDNFRMFYHSVNSCSHSVNGDIAIQWQWSNFDPSQNPNPLTDYDKTDYVHETNT